MSRDGIPMASEFWGGVGVTIGAAGVMATCLFYALSPSQVVAPMPNPDLSQALQAAISGGSMMWRAGTAGIIGDVITTAGALLLMVNRLQSGRGLQGLWWAVVAISALIFVVVDAVVGYVLPQVAALRGGEAAFAGFKFLFDVLFALGTLAFGAATLGIFWAQMRTGALVFGAIGVLAGALGILASLAYFAGLSLARPMGLSIVAGSVLFLILGARIAQHAAGTAPLPAGLGSR